MTHLDPIISDLALILAVAGVTTLLFKWLKQPVVLGYIVAGFLCSGNFLLQGVSNMGNVDIWAEIGIIFLLFSLGLEFSFKKLMNVGGPALMTALVVIVGMMCSGFMAGRALGWTSTDSIFLGGMLSMSSTTIIIKAFDDLGLRSQKFTSLVFGVLVVEDLFAVVLMVMLSTLFVQRAVEHVVIAEQLFKLIFFLILWFVVGIYLIPTFLKKIRKFLNQETLLVISLGLCLIMVVLATYAGFSSALGAFIMGSILAGTVQAESIEKVIAPVKDLFGAVFFVSVGMLVEPAMLVQYIVPIVFLTVVVIVGQIFYGTLGFLVSGQNLKIALQSSFSLAQIGEFAFIIASLGLSMGVTSSFLYPVAVAVSVVTTFTTPFIIRLSDPAYHRINRLIPKRMKALLARYSAGSQTVNSEREWMSLLKKSLLNMFIYCVLLGGVVWISSSYYSPFVEERFEGFAGKLIATTTTILFMTPLLWGLAVRHLNRRLFVPLWNDPRFNHGLLVSLIVLRILLALMFVLTVVAHLSSYRWGALMAFAILLLLLALFWRRIKRGYLRFEQRFFTNLNEKDASTVVTTGNYRAKFLHMAKMTVSADSPLVGRCFSDGGVGAARQPPVQCARRIDGADAVRRDFGRRDGCAVEPVRFEGRSAAVAGRSGRGDDAKIFGRRAFRTDRYDRFAVRHDVPRGLLDHRDRTQRRLVRQTAGTGAFSAVRYGLDRRRPGDDRTGARRNEASRTENGKKARTADSPQEMILSIRCQLKGILFFISPV